MFGFSLSHILIVGLIILIFGARKLPEVGAGLGKSIRAFKAAIEGQSFDTSDDSAATAAQRIAKDSSAIAEPVDRG